MRSILLSIALSLASFLNSYANDLDRSTGRIYEVNLEEKSIEFITTTAYDPKTNEGKTRHTVYWDESTTFFEVTPLDGFEDLEGAWVGHFYYLDPAQQVALKAGKVFDCRFVDVFDENRKATGLRADGKALTAKFKGTGARTARVEWDGKEVPFKGLGSRFSVKRIELADQQLLAEGIFEGRIFGNWVEDRFVLSSARVTRLPDPRDSDDPNLPRMLVIGDSISGNYNDAARTALEGIVNYHRIDGNGGSTVRGVESIDLWLGNYETEGFHWDIIQFNHGLHDLRQTRKETGEWGEHAVSADQYQKYLETIIAKLQQIGAKIIWCNTTPVPNDAGETSGRRKDEDLIYNQAALEVVSRYPNILVTDLNWTVRESPAFDEWRKGTNVHFYSETELKALGEAVAETVRQAVK